MLLGKGRAHPDSTAEVSIARRHQLVKDMFLTFKRLSHKGVRLPSGGFNLGLCARAGLVSLGVIALDGTKIAADASAAANRTYEQIAAELLADADAVDAAEGQQFGEARGDELPAERPTPYRVARGCGEAKDQMESEH